MTVLECSPRFNKGGVKTPIFDSELGKEDFGSKSA
jgi:hypothetical protein